MDWSCIYIVTRGSFAVAVSTQPHSRVNSDEALSPKFGTQVNDTENGSVFIGLAWQQSQSERNAGGHGHNEGRQKQHKKYRQTLLVTFVTRVSLLAWPGGLITALGDFCYNIMVNLQ